MAQDKILITGATGFLGSAILIDILQAGYTVNIVARSQSKIKQLQVCPAIAALNKESACKYFIVPDLTVEGGLDEATVGTNIVIHCASPLPFMSSDAENDMIIPAVKCTLRALESAQKAGTVKRVIVLSSLGAFAGPDIVDGTYIPPEEVFLGDKVNDDFGPPYHSPLIAYCAAKTAAYRRSIEWMEKAVAEGSVSFDMINLAPAYIYGPNPLATSVADLMLTSNSLLLPIIMGTGKVSSEEVEPRRPTLCGGLALDDFLEIVHKSLDLDKVKTPGSGPSKHISTYVQSTKFKWNDVYPIIARKWPREVEKGILAAEGDFPTKPNISFAVGDTERTFGMKLRGLEEILDVLVPYYIEMLKKENSKQQAV
ncbi:NADPH-dependent aldehyde reductase ARI1 [Cytospora mali]|uniref:NADPH-dependent aldehyde reductase ARI1 n=1 Tax=Cytospora mali TaxID=578113 RepID=A0A194UYZ4_CYTMA|nr:NADPH-dependent aldehyde reductase ARI1 [Valsa mali var. pyri (nom. inval.)]